MKKILESDELDAPVSDKSHNIIIKTPLRIATFKYPFYCHKYLGYHVIY